jgi:hypothetical protein
MRFFVLFFSVGGGKRVVSVEMTDVGDNRGLNATIVRAICTLEWCVFFFTIGMWIGAIVHLLLRPYKIEYSTNFVDFCTILTALIYIFYVM